VPLPHHTHTQHNPPPHPPHPHTPLAVVLLLAGGAELRAPVSEGSFGETLLTGPGRGYPGRGAATCTEPSPWLVCSWWAHTARGPRGTRPGGGAASPAARLDTKAPLRGGQEVNRCLVFCFFFFLFVFLFFLFFVVFVSCQRVVQRYCSLEFSSPNAPHTLYRKAENRAALASRVRELAGRVRARTTEDPTLWGDGGLPHRQPAALMFVMVPTFVATLIHLFRSGHMATNDSRMVEDHESTSGQDTCHRRRALRPPSSCPVAVCF